jgi:outer membrane murein-binding lipoprotein Lpp
MRFAPSRITMALIAVVASSCVATGCTSAAVPQAQARQNEKVAVAASPASSFTAPSPSPTALPKQKEAADAPECPGVAMTIWELLGDTYKCVQLRKKIDTLRDDGLTDGEIFTEMVGYAKMLCDPPGVATSATRAKESDAFLTLCAEK